MARCLQALMHELLHAQYVSGWQPMIVGFQIVCGSRLLLLFSCYVSITYVHGM